jgi:protein-tyrosine-phosphatase
MFKQIENLLHQLSNNFEQIPVERKLILHQLSNYLNKKMLTNEVINLTYICTHNSRRSHFGQIAATVVASYYNHKNVKSFSGGTEATAFNINAINALKNLGFVINTNDQNASNPVYLVSFEEHTSVICFSKTFDHDSNPPKNFAAIMTCSDAEQNCPYIIGAEVRIGTTYNDPKIADGTSQVNSVYEERFKQIVTETLYAFSNVNTKNNV